MMARFTTIGHSNRSLDEFLDMLREARGDPLVDVRSFPRSRSNPVFNIDRLPNELARLQFVYRHFPALGGRRSKQSGVDEALNAMWRVRSFHNYADYALGDEFATAFDDLVDHGRQQRLALMCAEAVWWLNGNDVVHLMTSGKTESAKPTVGAQRTGQGKVIYPANSADD